MKSASSLRIMLAMLVALGLVGGCTASVDKSGSPAVTTLTLGYADGAANANGQSYAGQAFVDALHAGFGDRLDLVVRGALGGNRRDGNQAVIRSIATGELDGGWVLSRGFEEAGFPGFDVLAAPMVITSYQAQAAMLEPESASVFLDLLDGTELVGLGLGVGGLRRPIGTDAPLLGAEDWAGTRFGIIADSQREAVVATGAIPVLAANYQNQLGQDFAAVELDMGRYGINLLAGQAPFVTANVVLWPAMWVLVMNRAKFDGLSAVDQQLVRDAAQEAARVSARGSHDETGLVADQCAAGARFPLATPSQVASLRDAFEPALRTIESDPLRAPLLAAVRAVAAEHPGVDVLRPPVGCGGDPAAPREVGAIPSTPSDIPAGTYRMTLSLQNLLDAGVEYDRALNNDSVSTLILDRDGGYRVIGDDIAPSPEGVYTNLLWEVGQVSGAGDRVYFVPDVEEFRRLKDSGVNAALDGPGYNIVVDPYTMKWRESDGVLTFSDVAGIADPIAVLWFTANPYERID
jgi:TRAP-type C4-dicarboxylate transport system substrate-binding protein